MASLNKVMIIGRLGKDPETRFANSGTAICTFSMATSRYYRDANNEQAEETEWHNIVFFGKTAEVAQKYLRKGSQAYIEGRIRTRKYTDKEGNNRYITEIVGEVLQLLDSRSDSFRGGDDGAGYTGGSDRRSGGSHGASDTGAGGSSSGGFEDDEDLPF